MFNLNYNKESLPKVLNREGIVTFWHESAPGQIAPGCLVQWYQSPFTVDGVTYPTAEHYMMVQKALLFKDTTIAEQMLRESVPEKVKKLGRQVKNFDSATWGAHCQKVVYDGNMAKFQQNKALLEYLLATKNKVLIEASPFDTIWGVGLGENCNAILKPQFWKGTNYLGFILMQVRDTLSK